MRFQFFSDTIARTPKIAVDGLAPDAVHLSHWAGNRTPAALKRDTSTEISLALAALSPSEQRDYTGGVELVTNNHFDADGILSVWALLAPASARESHSTIVAAAEAGDFAAWTSDDGVRVALALQGLDDESGSPLATSLGAGGDDVAAYEKCLPLVEKLVREPGAFEPLWRDRFARLARARESFAAGRSRVTIDGARRVALVVLAPGVDAPALAIGAQAGDADLILVATPTGNGLSYRADWAYHSWADTVVRRTIRRCDLTAAVEKLAARDPAAGFSVDGGGMTSAIRAAAPSRLAPDEVARELRHALETEGTE